MTKYKITLKWKSWVLLLSGLALMFVAGLFAGTRYYELGERLPVFEISYTALGALLGVMVVANLLFSLPENGEVKEIEEAKQSVKQ